MNIQADPERTKHLRPRNAMPYGAEETDGSQIKMVFAAVLVVIVLWVGVLVVLGQGLLTRLFT